MKIKLQEAIIIFLLTAIFVGMVAIGFEILQKQDLIIQRQQILIQDHNRIIGGY